MIFEKYYSFWIWYGPFWGEMVEFGKVWKRMQALHGCIVCIYSIYKDAPACTSILRYICAVDAEDFCPGSHEPSPTFRNQRQSSPTIHYQHTNSNLSKCWGQCKQCKGRVAVLVRYQIPVTHITCLAVFVICVPGAVYQEKQRYFWCQCNQYINRWCIGSSCQRQHEDLKWYKCIRSVPSFTGDGLTKVHWQCPA